MLRRTVGFFAVWLLALPLFAADEGNVNVPLWQLPPFDRIELINGEKHDIEPTRIPKGTEIEAVADEYIGQPGLPPFRELKRIPYYRIRLQEDGLEYDVLGKSIRKIDLYEDLLLKEAQRLMSEGKLDEAFDYLVRLTNYAPEWPGLLAARIAFHREEAERLSARGNWEQAFWALREEQRLRKEYDEKPVQGTKPELFGSGTLQDRLDVVSNRWFEQMLADRRFEEARKVIARLEEVTPESNVARQSRDRLRQMVADQIAKSKKQEAAGDLTAAWRSLEEAENIWPEAPELRSAIDELHSRFQVLKVAVDHLPSYRHGVAYWSRADIRCLELLHVPLMRLNPSGDNPRFVSEVIGSLEKANINKEAMLQLRPGLAWPSDGKPVTVIDLQRLLADSCQPGSPLFHPAFARLMTNLRPVLPNRLDMMFDRPQFEPAAWLQMPFLRLGHDAELAKLRTASAPGFSGLGPFRLTRIDAGQCAFAKNERYLEAEHPRLALVTEYRFRESADRLRALENGDVDLVAMVPPRQLQKVAAMEDVRLVEITRPRVHLIQFNLQRRELRNRTLRRAIDYAINRDAIFSKVQQPINEKNRPISGPLPFGSFGYNEKIEPRPFDRFLAKALIVGVRKELQTLPPLKLAHSGDETSRVACEMIVENLRSVGLNVSLVDLDADPSFPPGTADLRYQSYVVTDPIYDVVTLLTRDNPSLSEHGSPWFRQKLVELVDVPNLSVASEVLPELLRILHEDMVLVPLWQWTDHFAVSKGVSNLPEHPASVYQGVTEWTVTPRQPPSFLSPTVATGR